MSQVAPWQWRAATNDGWTTWVPVITDLVGDEPANASSRIGRARDRSTLLRPDLLRIVDIVYRRRLGVNVYVDT